MDNILITGRTDGKLLHMRESAFGCEVGQIVSIAIAHLYNDVRYIINAAEQAGADAVVRVLKIESRYGQRYTPVLVHDGCPGNNNDILSQYELENVKVKMYSEEMYSNPVIARFRGLVMLLQANNISVPDIFSCLDLRGRVK